MIASQFARTLVLGSALAFAACGGESLVLPDDGEPAHIEVVHGNGQSGRAGSVLADSVVVLVTDTKDREVAGATVNFTFPDGDAEAAPASATTNADGLAWVKVTLGAPVGPVAGLAEVPVDPGVSPVRAEFTATTLPGDANGIVAVSGDDQSAPVNSQLPEPLVVRVTDESGNPISGVSITWSVTGGGSVSSETTITDASGQASVTRTLGPGSGQQTALATATGLAGSPVTFTHTATAGSAAGVNIVSGNNQSALAGNELAQPLVVRVLDAEQNPIPNAAVTWIVTAGDGSVSEENTNTNAQGEASTRWTLGPAAGTNTLNAVVSGVGTATFNATGTAGTPSASNSTVTASPTSITAGTGTSTVTVTVRDASNNPVAGVSVTIASSGSGNTINPASANTDGNGVATFTFSSTVAETKTITANAGGVAISDDATITVNKASASVEITEDNPDPSNVGEAITVEVTVTGSGGTPTGSVTVTMSGGPESCQVTLNNGSGSCQLTPTAPSTAGNNRRDLTATYSGDANFSGDTDTENHTVRPVQNLPPVTQPDAYSTNEDAPLTVPAPGVLGNDQDPESAPLTAISASNPPNGSVTLNSDGSFTYTPDPDFFGNDSFTYRASDGTTSTAGTVTITVGPVNDAPSFNYLPTVTVPSGPQTIGDWATDVTAGPSNESGQALNFVVTSNSNPALFEVQPTVQVVPDANDTNGALSFSTASGQTGSANLTIELRDNEGGVAQATVSITVQ